MATPADPNRMVTIHGGPAWDVELLAMQLADAGIDCYFPEKMVRTVDPFITGANPLESRLQVRATDAARATEVIEQARARLEPGRVVGDDLDGEDDEESEGGEDSSAPREEVESLARRTRWAALFGLMVMGLTLPLAILTGWLYLRASRAYGIRSQAHGMTLAAFGFSLVAVVGFVLMWWGLLG